MSHIEVKKTDAAGDTFVKGYDRYVSGDVNSDVVKYHLGQFCENYNKCFGEYPTAEKLDAAFKFCYLFCAEIGENYPKSSYAHAASHLSSMIDNGLDTAEQLADLATTRISNKM